MYERLTALADVWKRLNQGLKQEADRNTWKEVESALSSDPLSCPSLHAWLGERVYDWEVNAVVATYGKVEQALSNRIAELSAFHSPPKDRKRYVIWRAKWIEAHPDVIALSGHLAYLRSQVSNLPYLASLRRT